ncbi:MAG TPA: SPFH domain-containing protein [Verrucomicrobiota bacterium]|nr:SPFH domain-containing protein [Verrucomicrobiota bacterium]HNT16153.1 SPFH domain-containing protein [Verrucomicrobiota bacterium]
MNENHAKSASVERETTAVNGWVMLIFNLALLLGALAGLIWTIVQTAQAQNPALLWWLIPVTLAEVLAVVLLCGHFTLQPNEARVLILFGDYKGTVRTSGFWWANPFYSRCRGRVPLPADAVPAEKLKSIGTRQQLQNLLQRPLPVKLSLRARNFNSDKLKVNDKRGNPIEIAAVIVWRVEDTAKAAFDVDDFESYVHIQSESAIRHIASLFAYDRGEEHEPTLRESADEVAAALGRELQERLGKAGVVVEEARLTHLAYAPEIAQAMLRRQQAEAVIAARQKIVHGAVSMVEMALRDLSEKQVVKLDEERKAAMVSNLLVVLCSDSDATPVINTGTLYS